MTDFPQLLARFSAAMTGNDGEGFAKLFTPDGVYDDGFYGEYAGSEAIVKMIRHFHEVGTNYRWDFVDPVSDGRTGYAFYRTSFESRVPGHEGKSVVFDGISRFTLRDGLVARYGEIFDRGAALAQQDFSAERIKRVLGKFADKQRASVEGREHLARLTRAG